MQARVVIVDDRPTNLRIYAQYVAMMGTEFEAKCFDRPGEALAWLEHESADLLIVDYRMPEMNGAEFLRRVRARALGGDVPAIMITAHQDRECRLAALDAGATDFLQSPVSHVEFRDRAVALIDQKRRKSDMARRASNVDRHHVTEGSSGTGGKSMLEQIIDTIPIMINATDRDGRCLFMNAYQAAMFNRHPEELVGKQVSTLMPVSQGERELRRDAIVLESGEPIPHYEEKFASDGVELIFHCNKSPLTNHEGKAIGVLTTAVDITARKFAEEHRTHLALHDMLTGLPNRALLSERLRVTIEECRESGEQAALLLVDLDRFKVINDTRGHQTGDILLREVAERITKVIHAEDFAARIGGDEFALILRHVANVDDIAGHCLRLLTALNQPFRINGVDQVIGASIGIALIPADGDSQDELLRLADLAMYDAKARGRNGFCFFSPALNQIAQANAQLEIELRNALANDEFVLEYQPIVEVGSLRYIGLEALLRWQHPTRGRLLPHEFLRVADDSGLMDLIGRWVIGAACRQIVAFTRDGVEVPRIAINISPRQFHTHDIGGEILSQIERHGLDPQRLTIEITEELLLDRNQSVTAALRDLRARGVGISIDDFGTGYSSLQYLRDLPANRLKIDRAFVSRIETSSADRAIVSTIAHLAHALGMRVVAEGVERASQFDLLSAAGCDEIQGFLIGHPMEPTKIADLFRRGNGRYAANAQ